MSSHTQSFPSIAAFKAAVQAPVVPVKPAFAYSRGLDPEWHLKRASDGMLISAIPVLKRDKHDPIELGNGVRAYHDNIMAECSCPPSYTKAEMMGRMRDMMQRLQDHIGPEYRIEALSAHEYSDDQLIEPAARMVGCTPSFSAWSGEQNPIPDFSASGFRTGSFHIHLGNTRFDGENDGQLLTHESRRDCAQLLDVFLGLSSVICDPDDTASLRRRWYGRAGEVRPAPFGLEYRVLGGAMLRSPALADLVLDLVDHVMSFTATFSEYKVLGLVDGEQVQHAINTCDKGLARALLAQAGLPEHLMARVERDYSDADLYRDWDVRVRDAVATPVHATISSLRA